MTGSHYAYVQVGTILPVLQAYLAPAGQGTGAGIQAQLLLPDSPFRAMLTPAQEAGTATSGEQEHFCICQYPLSLVLCSWFVCNLLAKSDALLYRT